MRYRADRNSAGSGRWGESSRTRRDEPAWYRLGRPDTCADASGRRRDHRM